MTINITDKNTIKSWFKRGLKPLETQFAAWMDSYWHKSELIPTGSVEGLEETLNNKAESAALGEFSDDLARHKADDTRHKTAGEQFKLDHLAENPDATYLTAVDLRNDSCAYYEVLVRDQEEFEAALAALGTHGGKLDKIICASEAVVNFTIKNPIVKPVEFVMKPNSRLGYTPNEESTGDITLSSTMSITTVARLRAQNVRVIGGQFNFTQLYISETLTVLNSCVSVTMGNIERIYGTASVVSIGGGCKVINNMMTYSANRLSGEWFATSVRSVGYRTNANGYVPALPADFKTQAETPMMLGGQGWTKPFDGWTMFNYENSMGNGVLIKTAIAPKLAGSSPSYDNYVLDTMDGLGVMKIQIIDYSTEGETDESNYFMISALSIGDQMMNYNAKYRIVDNKLEFLFTDANDMPSYFRAYNSNNPSISLIESVTFIGDVDLASCHEIIPEILLSSSAVPENRLILKGDETDATLSEKQRSDLGIFINQVIHSKRLSFNIQIRDFASSEADYSTAKLFNGTVHLNSINLNRLVVTITCTRVNEENRIEMFRITCTRLNGIITSFTMTPVEVVIDPADIMKPSRIQLVAALPTDLSGLKEGDIIIKTA